MRDILFKAKRIDNGEWVEGYYVYHIKRTICAFADCVKPEDEQHVIMQDGFSDWNMPRDTVHYDIDPNTLCQYTGLKDKNDKKIFEGDLILLMDRWYCAVEYDVENARFILNGEYVKNEDEDEVTHSSFAPYYQNEIEVIGNIFDNPELLNYADNEASQQAHQEVLKLATE